MSWSKVFTAIKGAVSETGETIADNQAIRIMDQELREASTEIDKAKTELTSIMAKRKGNARKVDELGKKIAEHEKFAAEALDKNDEDLARNICERIGSFDEQLEIEKSLLQSFTTSEQSLKANLKKAEARLKQLKQQQDVLKATEAVQKVQSNVASRFPVRRPKWVMPWILWTGLKSANKNDRTVFPRPKNWPKKPAVMI